MKESILNNRKQLKLLKLKRKGEKNILMLKKRSLKILGKKKIKRKERKRIKQEEKKIKKRRKKNKCKIITMIRRLR
jgi:hypothetical protein